MKNTLIASGIFATLLMSTQAHAGAGGSCHFHGNKPVDQSVVIDCANQRVGALAKAGKLEASWAKVKHSSIEQVTGKKGPEWKLTYRNPAVADKTKQSLYLFYAPAGHFIAANHDGR